MKNLLVLAIACIFLLPITTQAESKQTQSKVSSSDGSEVSSDASSKGPASEGKVEFSKLSAGVWMHTSYKNVEPWGLVLTNGLVVEREDYTVLVDTAWNNAQTAQIIKWANEALGKPIKASIHTHAHSDKMGGMAALHTKGIETYASSMSNEFAPKHDLLPAKNSLDLATVAMQLSWHGLSVMYPGGGHTLDNIVVYDELSQIIFGGCLIRPGSSRSLGFTGDADLEFWSKAAQNVAEAFPKATIVVPSHGQPGGLEVLTNTIEITKPKG